jgi:predicted transcriptional regulator
MNTSVQNRKNKLIQWLSSLEDESIIEKVAKIREAEEKDWWDELSVAEKESIERGMADIDAGRVKTQEEVDKLFAKWR